MKGLQRLKSLFHFSPQKLSMPLLIFLICVLLLIIFAWPDPASGQFSLQMTLASPTLTYGSSTPTPIPSDYIQTADQTAGIILGSIVLVLIVLVGTLGVLRRKNDSAAH